ncbi:MAG: hypothetical protein FJ145_06040 [Deltaproteobacteria bacterium]|nr:hypothetical protein [Deltaproteobacteria bacterium]
MATTLEILTQPKMSLRISLRDLVAKVESADHAIAYFKKPLPEPMLEGLRLLAARRGHGSLDLVAEKIDDIDYLKKLRLTGAAVYDGAGLPQETLVIIDRNRGYWLAADADPAGGDLVAADNAPDLYLRLLYRRFGLAVSYEGKVKENHPGAGFFCVRLEDQRDVWCRFSESRSNGLPPAGTRVQLFGWIKWNSHIMEVLELSALG